MAQAHAPLGHQTADREAQTKPQNSQVAAGNESVRSAREREKAHCRVSVLSSQQKLMFSPDGGLQMPNVILDHIFCFRKQTVYRWTQGPVFCFGHSTS